MSTEPRLSSFDNQQRCYVISQVRLLFQEILKPALPPKEIVTVTLSLGPKFCVPSHSGWHSEEEEELGRGRTVLSRGAGTSSISGKLELTLKPCSVSLGLSFHLSKSSCPSCCVHASHAGRARGGLYSGLGLWVDPGHKCFPPIRVSQDQEPK